MVELPLGTTLPGPPAAAAPPKVTTDDAQSDAETESTVEGDSAPETESIVWADSSDGCSSDEDMDAAPVAAPAALASDVLTRNELLAMAPLGQRRTRKEVTCLPVMVPAASLAAVVLAPAPCPVAVGNEESDFQRRVLAAAQKLTAPQEKAGSDVAPLMRELEELAARVANADEMLAQALAAAPAEGSDAVSWHGVALKTLGWSRQELLRRQREALLRLVELAERSEAVPSSRFSVAPSPVARRSIPEKLPLAPPPGLELLAEKPKSMTNGLESLRSHRPECILKVRKLKKLGFESSALLRKHLERFGEVLDVCVSHSVVKPNPKRPGGRSRPAAVGFVVMADEAGAAAVLVEGQEQLVAGVAIEVAAFDPFLDSNADAADE